MARTRRRTALMLFHVARAHRQRFLPVLPVFILQQNGNRRTNALAMPHPGDYVDFVGLNLHAAAAAEPLLASPQFAIEKSLVNFQSGRHAGKIGHKGLSVRLSGSEVTKHGRGKPRRGTAPASYDALYPNF